MSGPGREPTISDEEILDAFRQSPDPVLTTSEIAEQIGLKRRGTFDRLTRLNGEGRIEMKKVGETGAVWWFPEALRQKYNSKP